MVLPAVDGWIEGRDCGGAAGGVCDEFPGAVFEGISVVWFAVRTHHFVDIRQTLDDASREVV